MFLIDKYRCSGEKVWVSVIRISPGTLIPIGQVKAVHCSWLNLEFPAARLCVSQTRKKWGVSFFPDVIHLDPSPSWKACSIELQGECDSSRSF